MSHCIEAIQLRNRRKGNPLTKSTEQWPTLVGRISGRLKFRRSLGLQEMINITRNVWVLKKNLCFKYVEKLARGRSAVGKR